MNTNKRTIDKKDKSSRLKIIGWGFIIFLFLASYVGFFHFAEPKLFPLRHIKVEASCEHINLNSLRSKINPHIKGFFSTNMTALKKDILTDPFVDEVIIRRVWPDTLLVSLREVQLVASWEGEAAVNSKGEVMAVKADPNKHLPIFHGPLGQAGKILEQYLALTARLQPFNLSITEIMLSQRRSWQVTLNDGVKVLLGRKEVEEHLSTFVSIYPKLKKIHGDSISSVDLRHSNGLSVNIGN